MDQLKAKLLSALDGYADAVDQSAVGGWTLVDFVQYILSEEMNRTERDEVSEAIVMINHLQGTNWSGA